MSNKISQHASLSCDAQLSLEAMRGQPAAASGNNRAAMLVSVINTSFKLFNKLTIMVQVNNTHTGNFFQVTDKHTRHSKMFQTLAASDETISNSLLFIILLSLKPIASSYLLMSIAGLSASA